MSVWLTPDLKPVVGATYFPPTDKYGRPGFSTILTLLAKQVFPDHSTYVNQVNDVIQFSKQHFCDCHNLYFKGGQQCTYIF